MLNTKDKYSPSDLVSFYLSPYESILKKYLIENGDPYAELDPDDPFQKIISAKGEDHEKTVLKNFTNQKLSLIKIPNLKKHEMEQQTLKPCRMEWILFTKALSLILIFMEEQTSW